MEYFTLNVAEAHWFWDMDIMIWAQGLVDNSRAFVDRHLVWAIAILTLVVLAAMKSLSSTNVERERNIRGGHYKGKVTPKWMKTFAKEQSIRDEKAMRARNKRAQRKR